MLLNNSRSRFTRTSPRSWIGRVGLDVLEGRQVPASLVSVWPDAQHLTLSFAPDGTNIGGGANVLNQTLNSEFGTTDPKVWQRAILRAAQTWASVSNVNIGVVKDGGQALGAPGAPEGDSRFGDIRIGAKPLSPGVLALTQPPSLVSGTWAGDVTLNSSASFGPDADLYTVALHEFGHALGLDDNTTDPTSVMYGEYNGVRTGLGGSDVGAIQSLYGARQDDAFEGSQGNDSFKTAASISYDANFGTTQVQSVRGDLTTHSDQDYLSFKVPAGKSSADVRLRTSGTSLLEGRVTVYDQSKNLLGTATAADPFSGDLVVHLSGLTSNASYYVDAQGASPDSSGIGAYELQLDYRTSPPPDSTTVPTGFLKVDNHSNDTINSATVFSKRRFESDPRFQYTEKASISDPTDVDMYWIAHTSNEPLHSTMTVTAWGMETNGLQPIITVYDIHNRAVDASVLFNENGTYTIQVPNANTTGYTIAVRAASPAAHATGNYFLGVDFGNPPTTLNALGSGQVAPGTDGVDVPITAVHDDLFHFTLTGSAASPTDSAVQLTIYDGLGRAVATLTAGSHQTQSLTLFLGAGTYTARFRYVAGTVGSAVPLSYTLLGADLSDPIKVYSSTGGGASTPQA